jgi:hypothetical protein
MNFCILLLLCVPLAVRTLSTPLPNLAIPGGGIYYYHLAGQLKHLRETYPIFETAPSSPPRYTLHGASAGALAATLWSYDVSIEDATTEAIRLSDEIDLWNRKLGLYGIWGPIIRSWLDTLLPPSSTFIPPTNINLLLTPATYKHLTDSSLSRYKVSSFGTKEEVRSDQRQGKGVPFPPVFSLAAHSPPSSSTQIWRPFTSLSSLIIPSRQNSDRSATSTVRSCPLPKTTALPRLPRFSITKGMRN